MSYLLLTVTECMVRHSAYQVSYSVTAQYGNHYHSITSGFTTISSSWYNQGTHRCSFSCNILPQLTTWIQLHQREALIYGWPGANCWHLWLAILSAALFKLRFLFHSRIMCLGDLCGQIPASNASCMTWLLEINILSKKVRRQIDIHEDDIVIMIPNHPATSLYSCIAIISCENSISTNLLRFDSRWGPLCS